jgi:hypothetical protein
MNVGGGDACVFKCKLTGNLLQFRSISATGSSIQIFQTDDEILISGATGGGSGTITGAINGLGVTGSSVCLGGTLVNNTNINANAKQFCVCNASSIVLSSTGVGNSVTVGDNNTHNTYVCSTCNLQMQTKQLTVGFTSTGTVNDTSGTPRGLRYGGNYRANFLCDSLVDAAYVSGLTNTAAGGNGEIQFNCNGAFAASTLFCWNSSTGELKNEGGGGVAPSLFLRNAGGSNAYVKLTSTSPPTVCLYASHVDSKVHLGNNGCVIIPSMPSGVTASAVYYNTSTGQLTRGAVGGGSDSLGWSCGDTLVIGCGTLAYSIPLTGITNTILGVNAGRGGIAIGYNALKNHLSGSTSRTNIAIGNDALCAATNSNHDIAIGHCALLKVTGNGNQNVAIGNYAMCNASQASDSVAIGLNALCGNQNGGQNVVIGSQSGKNITSGCNVIVGSYSTCSLTSGAANISIGVCSNQLLNTGSCNVAVGYSAGYNNLGSGNLFLGTRAGSGFTGSHTLIISNCQSCDLIRGNFTGKTVTVCGTITADDFILSSDERLKTNVQAISITPIDVEYKQFEFILQPNQIRYGVIAQELQKVSPELITINDRGMLGVSYIDLLVKEVASLKCRVCELEKRIG